MDLQVLRFFVTVAQEGGFTAASEKLHYAQSNLSTRVRQMEEELGETLFYRNKRGVTLTAKGELFYEYANRILNMSDEAVTAMRDMDHARGSLMIGSIEATALGDLPGLFADYHREYPDVKLSLTTDMNDVFVDKVLNREIDGAFVAESPGRKELDEIFIKNEKLVFIASAQESAIEWLTRMNSTEKTPGRKYFPQTSGTVTRITWKSLPCTNDHPEFTGCAAGQYLFRTRHRFSAGIHHRVLYSTGFDEEI